MGPASRWFSRLPVGFIEHLNPWFQKGNPPHFIKFPERLLESLFADAELLADGRRRTVIVKIQSSAIAFERLQDFLRQRGDAFVTRRVEAQINLPAHPDRAHKTFQPGADLERGGQVVFVE